jgi:predicted molibdopterin-dependent oxidoreductase YjgC
MNYKTPKEIMEEIASLTPIYKGISYEKLDSIAGIQWPCFDKSHTGTTFLYKNSFARGNGYFAPVDFIQGSEVPDKEYPYLLITGRKEYYFHTGSMTRKSPLLEREFPNGFVEINPTDADDLKVKSGWKVKIASKHGQLATNVLITTRVPEKTVFIPFQFKEGVANLLLGKPDLDPKSKIPEFKVCAVKISSI